MAAVAGRLSRRDAALARARAHARPSYGWMMNELDLRTTNLDGLRRLLAIDGSGSGDWGPDELAAVWAQARELQVDELLDAPSGPARSLAGGPRVREVLYDGASLAVLMELKRVTKDLMSATAGTIPGQVASVLYHGAIARALLGHGQRISSISDAQLAEGLRWAAHQPWLDGTARDVMQRLADDVMASIGGGKG